MGALRVELLGSAERERAAEVWAALEARVRPPLACTWRWTGTWLRHFGDEVPHEFALVERNGETVAAVLLARSVRRAAGVPLLRRVHLGTAGEPGRGVWVERNGLLAADRDRSRVAAALLESLAERGGWDELCLDGFIPEHARDLLAGAVDGTAAETRREPCPVRSLSAARAAGPDATAALAPGTRRRVRQGIRRLGDVSTEIARDGEQAARFFQELVGLHEARWSPGAFADRRVLAFHRELIAGAGGTDPVWVSRTASAGGTIGCLYGFLDREPDGTAALFYQSGLARFAHNAVRPGLIAHAGLIGALLERDVELIDYLAGDSRYKRELSDGERELVWARLGGRAVRSRASRAARGVRRAVRS